MKRGYFVAGTDTGVGKTVASCALIRSLSARGKIVAAMKPVSSGGDDVLRLAASGGRVLPPELACPYALSEPVAPHIAASHAGIRIDIGRILHAYRKIDADIVIVEGTGGLLVPLNESEDTSDLAVRLGLPVVLVVGMKLGAISHALLTAEALKSRGLRLEGWLANSLEPEMAAFGEVLDGIACRIGAPLLDVLPYDPEERFLADVSKLV